ncbi:MAG: hypothetical protein WD295_02170 [Bacteroidota bacterium]
MWLRFSRVPVLTLVLFCSPLYAQRSVPMNIERLIAEAGIIFAGEVIDIETGERDRMNLYMTRYTFRVHDALYGVEEDTIVIKQYGGEADGRRFYPPGVPRYAMGEQVLVFFYPPSRIGMTSAVGLDQGKFALTADDSTGERFLITASSNAHLFKGLRHRNQVVREAWLTGKTPELLGYEEMVATTRNLIGVLKR